MGFLTDAFYVIGDADSSLALTATDQTSTKIADVSGATRIRINVLYTPGANTRNVTITPEINADALGWGGLAIGQDSAVVSGVVTTTLSRNQFVLPGATASTAYTASIPISGGFGANTQLRIKVKEDGAGTFGTVKVKIDIFYS